MLNDESSNQIHGLSNPVQETISPVKVRPVSSLSSVNEMMRSDSNKVSVRESPVNKPKRHSNDSPYFNFTPLSMQQSTSFTGMQSGSVSKFE